MAATIEGILKEVRQYRSSTDGNIAAKIVVEFNALGNLEVIQELNRICAPDKLVKAIILGEDEWDDFVVTPTGKAKEKVKVKVEGK